MKYSYWTVVDGGLGTTTNVRTAADFEPAVFSHARRTREANTVETLLAGMDTSPIAALILFHLGGTNPKYLCLDALPNTPKLFPTGIPGRITCRPTLALRKCSHRLLDFRGWGSLCVAMTRDDFFRTLCGDDFQGPFSFEDKLHSTLPSEVDLVESTRRDYYYCGQLIRENSVAMLVGVHEDTIAKVEEALILGAKDAPEFHAKLLHYHERAKARRNSRRRLREKVWEIVMEVVKFAGLGEPLAEILPWLGSVAPQFCVPSFLTRQMEEFHAIVADAQSHSQDSNAFESDLIEILRDRVALFANEAVGV